MEARVSSRVLDGRVRASRSEHFLCDVCAHGGRYLYLDTADDLRKHLRCGRAAPSSAPHVPKQAYVHAAAPALPPHAVQGCADAAMNALHWPAQLQCVYLRAQQRLGVVQWRVRRMEHQTVQPCCELTSDARLYTTEQRRHVLGCLLARRALCSRPL